MQKILKFLLSKHLDTHMENSLKKAPIFFDPDTEAAANTTLVKAVEKYSWSNLERQTGMIFDHFLTQMESQAGQSGESAAAANA